MARAGINRALVKKARLAIVSRGEKPSIDAVRIELGNTGSKTTIHRYLKELDESEKASPSKVTLSEQLNNLVSGLAESLQQEAEQSVCQARESLEQEKAEYRLTLHSTQEKLLLLEAQQIRQQTELSELKECNGMLSQQVHSLDVERASLQQKLTDQDMRLQERTGQIVSLEEKHRHARDTLEHYRQAAREQRDQEQRQHETSVQGLQVEIRKLQQSLLVNQHELTVSARDNERLRTEMQCLREDNAELSSTQASLHQQLLELREIHGALQGNRDLLQQRLEQAELRLETLFPLMGINQMLENQLKTLQQDLLSRTAELENSRSENRALYKQLLAITTTHPQEKESDCVSSGET